MSKRDTVTAIVAAVMIFLCGLSAGIGYARHFIDRQVRFIVAEEAALAVSKWHRENCK